jgi:hypothetical protein
MTSALSSVSDGVWRRVLLLTFPLVVVCVKIIKKKERERKRERDIQREGWTI